MLALLRGALITDALITDGRST